jgi:hypothetical protein
MTKTMDSGEKTLDDYGALCRFFRSIIKVTRIFNILRGAGCKQKYFFHLIIIRLRFSFGFVGFPSAHATLFQTA